MAIYPGGNQPEKNHAGQFLLALSMTGFKCLAWINGLGITLVMLCALGVVQTNLAPSLFKLPLAAFSGGLALCGLGLFWTYFAQADLFNRHVLGRIRRAQWIPALCLMAAYVLSLFAFVAGCWFTVSFAGLVYQEPDTDDSAPFSNQDDAAPFEQSGRAFELRNDGQSPVAVLHAYCVLNPHA